MDQPSMDQPRAYRHIVSLGGDCRVAHNIRRTFPGSAAYPFDWWVASVPSVTAFLRDPDADLLYRPENLFRAWVDGRPAAVEDRRYGIRLFHEFPKYETGAPDRFAELIDEPRDRTAHLVRRLLALAATDDPILFVRTRIFRDTRDPGVFAEQVDELRRALERWFGPRTRFDLLLVNAPALPPADGLLQERFIDEGDWKGDEDAWSRMFRSVASAATSGTCRSG